jgi:hypothetical protein
MNPGMSLAGRFCVTFVALLTVATPQLGCSSSGDAPSGTIAPPPGGSAAGTNAGGAASMLGMAGTGSGPAMACTSSADCSTKGALCEAGFCACTPDKPDTCGASAATCVSKASDAENCGACDTKCDAGATCNAGKCRSAPTELATDMGCGGGVRLAIHGPNLYWTEKATGKVRTMPIEGGAISDVATGQRSPTEIAVDANGVYWANQGDGTAASSQVLKKALPLADAAPIALKSAVATETFPAIAVGAGKLYYAVHTDVHQISTDEGVAADIIVGRSVNFGNPAMPVVYGEVVNLAVSDTKVIWGTPGTRNVVETHTLTAWDDVTDMTGYARLGKTVTTTSDVGIDANYGYWRDGERFLRDVVDAKVALAEVVTLAPYSKLITAFAINANAVYASTEDGGIFTHSLIPANPADDKAIVPPVLFARDQTNVTSIVLDATTLYWVTSDCKLRAAPL